MGHPCSAMGVSRNHLHNTMGDQPQSSILFVRHFLEEESDAKDGGRREGKLGADERISG